MVRHFRLSHQPMCAGIQWNLEFTVALHARMNKNSWVRRQDVQFNVVNVSVCFFINWIAVCQSPCLPSCFPVDALETARPFPKLLPAKADRTRRTMLFCGRAAEECWGGVILQGWSELSFHVLYCWWTFHPPNQLRCLISRYLHCFCPNRRTPDFVHQLVLSIWLVSSHCPDPKTFEFSFQKIWKTVICSEFWCGTKAKEQLIHTDSSSWWYVH